MAMTTYTGNTTVISTIGTDPAERGLTTDQFKAKFDEALKAFVAWFNSTHKTEFDAHLADIVQTDEVNSSTKYPSAAVTYAHGQEIDGITTPTIKSTVNVPEIAGVTTDAGYITAGKYRVHKFSNGEKMLDMTVYISLSSLSNGVIGTLPVGYRPLVTISKIVYDYLGNSQYYRLTLGTSGSIILNTVGYGAVPTTGNVKIAEQIKFS